MSARAVPWRPGCPGCDRLVPVHLFPVAQALPGTGSAGTGIESRRPRPVSPVRWTPADEAAVRKMREQYPCFGKRRLYVMPAHEGRHLPESTVEHTLEKPVGLGIHRRAHPGETGGPEPCQALQLLPQTHPDSETPELPYRPCAALDTGRPGNRARQGSADRPHDALPRRQDAQGMPNRLPERQVHGDPGVLPGYRWQCRTLPGRRHRGHAMPAPVDPGRWRPRVPCRIRRGLPVPGYPAVCPAPKKPPAERGRGKAGDSARSSSGASTPASSTSARPVTHLPTAGTSTTA